MAAFALQFLADFNQRTTTDGTRRTSVRIRLVLCSFRRGCRIKGDVHIIHLPAIGMYPDCVTLFLFAAILCLLRSPCLYHLDDSFGSVSRQGRDDLCFVFPFH